jgi:uncharacterized protein (TIRG00374 family)
VTEEPETPARPNGKKALIAAGVAVVVAVVVFGVILPQLVDWNLVGEALRTASGWDMAIILALALLWYWPSGWIYSLVLPGLSIRRGVECWVATTAVSSTVPGFDLALRVAMYTSWGFPIERSTAGMFLSGVVEQFTKIALAIAAVAIWALVAADLPSLAVAGIAAAVVAAVAVVVALVLRREHHARRVGVVAQRVVHWGADKLGRQAPEDVVDRVLGVRLEARQVLGSRWPASFVAAFLGQAILYSILTVSLRAVGVGGDLVDWSDILLVQGLAIILTSIPITPGSVGVAELVYIGLFNLITNGAAPNEVAAGVILYRLATWLLPIPIGWVLTLRWQSRYSQNLFGASRPSAASGPGS